MQKSAAKELWNPDTIRNGILRFCCTALEIKQALSLLIS